MLLFILLKQQINHVLKGWSFCPLSATRYLIPSSWFLLLINDVGSANALDTFLNIFNTLWYLRQQIHYKNTFVLPDKT